MVVWITILLKHRAQILFPMLHPCPLTSETPCETIFHKLVLIGAYPCDWQHPCLPWHHYLKRRHAIRSADIGIGLALNPSSTVYCQSTSLISLRLILLIWKMGIPQHRAIWGLKVLTHGRHLEGRLVRGEHCVSARHRYCWYLGLPTWTTAQRPPNQPVPKTDGRLHPTGIKCF